jgi:hypothetical protein
VAGVVAVDELDELAEADLGLVEQWATQLDELVELIGPRFFRPEPRERALAYVKGLLSLVCPKNSGHLLRVLITPRTARSGTRCGPL